MICNIIMQTVFFSGLLLQLKISVPALFIFSLRKTMPHFFGDPLYSFFFCFLFVVYSNTK